MCLLDSYRFIKGMAERNLSEERALARNWRVCSSLLASAHSQWDLVLLMVGSCGHLQIPQCMLLFTCHRLLAGRLFMEGACCRTYGSQQTRQTKRVNTSHKQSFEEEPNPEEDKNLATKRIFWPCFTFQYSFTGPSLGVNRPGYELPACWVNTQPHLSVLRHFIMTTTWVSQGRHRSLDQVIG